MKPLVFALLACAHAVACADITRWDDLADGMEPGDCEAEWATEHVRAPGQARERGVALTLGCGISWQSELTAEVERQRDGDGRQQRVALEASHVLRAESASGAPGWTLIAGLGWQRDEALAWRRADGVLALELAARVGPDWRLEGTLGWQHDRLARRDSGLWLLAAERAFGDTLEWRIELEGDDREPPAAAVALRWQTPLEDLALTLSHGRRLGSPRERLLGLAVGLEF